MSGAATGMGAFLDATFLSSRASYYTTFLKHCGRGKYCRICLSIVVEVNTA